MEQSNNQCDSGTIKQSKHHNGTIKHSMSQWNNQTHHVTMEQSNTPCHNGTIKHTMSQWNNQTIHITMEQSNTPCHNGTIKHTMSQWNNQTHHVTTEQLYNPYHNGTMKQSMSQWNNQWITMENWLYLATVYRKILGLCICHHFCEVDCIYINMWFNIQRLTHLEVAHHRGENRVLPAGFL